MGLVRLEDTKKKPNVYWAAQGTDRYREITTAELSGHYGYFRSNRKFIYHAIGCGVMLKYRNGKYPKGFGALIERVKNFPNHGYQARARFLTYFGVNAYAGYLSSDLWKAIRSEALEKTGGRCSFCGNKASEVHHHSYDVATLCGANLDRLHPVCRKCHESIEFDEEGRKRAFGAVVKETLEKEKRNNKE